MGQRYEGRHRRGAHRRPNGPKRWTLPLAFLLVCGLGFAVDRPSPSDAPLHALTTIAVGQLDTDMRAEVIEMRAKALARERAQASAAWRTKRAARSAERTRVKVEVPPARALVSVRNAVRATQWVRPVAGYMVTSGYGYRRGKLHPAVDLAVPVGTPVKSMSSGRVLFAGWSSQGYGYLVKVRHWNGTVTWYAHNSRILVRPGQWLQPGQWVARSGNSGHSTGPHLHLEIHPRNGAPVSPAPWMRARGIPL